MALLSREEVDKEDTDSVRKEISGGGWSKSGLFEEVTWKVTDEKN